MVEAAALSPPMSGPPPIVDGIAARVEISVIAIHRDVASASAAWDQLESVAPASPYQTRRWIEAWLDTSGTALGVSPLIVVATDANGPLALLPFGMWRRGGLVVAGFLGGRDSNCNLGLFRPGTPWDRHAILTLLRRGIASAKADVDVIILQNQPLGWEGIANPLALLPRQASPSFVHKVDLQPDPEGFFRTVLSKDTRKKLRRKEQRLAMLGTVVYREAKSESDRLETLDAFVRQRTTRNLAIGLAVANLARLKRFVDHASVVRRHGRPAVELHALYCGDRIVATFIGTQHRARFCGMSLSFDAEPALARCSPGDLMVRALLQAKCQAGVRVFDLGIGEARYKDTFCPTPEPLVDSIVPITLRGQMFAHAERLRLIAKRSIKQSAWAWSTIRVLRRGWAEVQGR